MGRGMSEREYVELMLASARAYLAHAEEIDSNPELSLERKPELAARWYELKMSLSAFTAISVFEAYIAADDAKQKQSGAANGV